MGWFDNLRRKAEPERATPKATSGMDAGATTRRLRSFQPSQEHINVLLAKAGKSMTARARYLVRNNGYAANAVDAWASHAVGVGIKPNPPAALVQGRARNRLLEAWTTWTDEADADGLTDFYGLQRRVARECFIAGECFVRFRPRKPEDGLSVPLQLQVLPAEMLDVSYSVALPGGNIVRNGIEFDAIGRRVAYHFWRFHPGDANVAGTVAQDRVPVPASEVLHVYDPVEAGQVRGTSRFAPAIVKLFMLDAYDDAELDRKKTTAMFAAFVKRTADGEDPFADAGQGDPDGEAGAGDEGGGLLPLEPGIIQYLDEGEDVTFSQPSEVGGSYEPFQYRTLLQIAAALGIPYAYLTGDPTKANFSSSRGLLLDFRRRVETFQHSVVVFLFCRAVWARWLETAVTAGAVSLPQYEARRLEYRTVAWLPPRWDWVDPFKDAQAEIAQINAKLKSRTQAVSERGYDVETVDAEIAADTAREKRLGLPPSPAPGSPGGAADSGADDSEDKPDKPDKPQE